MKTTVVSCLVALAISTGMAGMVGATVIDFEGDPGGNSYIPNGYHGFNWTADTNIGAIKSSSAATGYHLLDPDGYVAYNWGGGDPSTISLIGSGTFDFNSADWRSAWQKSQTLTLKGYNNGVELYSTTTTIYQYQETTHLVLNWAGLDKLMIWTDGSGSGSGTPYRDRSHWAMDNFTYNEPLAAVPEPATMLLFGTGLLGLVGYNRKRFKK